jgi:putative spermidine/putrescine transport system ATP-binding protein
MTAVRMAGVRREFGAVTALAGLDLELAPGELVALLGPSGCGKTTALRILAGFERPDGGTVEVGGRDITGVPASKRDMGMVFQAYSLFPNMDARSNVAFGLRMRKQPAARRRARASELLEIVGLGDAGDRYPHQLSGGQQQRVALARALAIEPTVLLLDEPLSALDALVRHQLRAEIRRVQQTLGITTLFVTHDQGEALSMADRVGVMRAGQLEQVGVPEEVYAHPATPFVAEFVGTMNRLDGELRAGGRVSVLGSELAALEAGSRAAGARVDVLLRPEAIGVDPDEAGAARVRERTFLGSVTRLVVAVDGGGEVVAEVPSPATGADVGARVSLRVLADRALVADPVEAASDAVADAEAAAGVVAPA